jgi:hypothetical protein
VRQGLLEPIPLFKDLQGLKEHKGLQEQQETLVRILLLLVLLALLEALVQLVLLVLQDRLGPHLQFLDQLGLRERKDFKASRVPLVLEGIQVLLETLDPLELQVILALQVTLVLKDQSGLQATLELLEIQVRKVLLEQQVLLDLLETEVDMTIYSNQQQLMRMNLVCLGGLSLIIQHRRVYLLYTLTFLMLDKVVFLLQTGMTQHQLTKDKSLYITEIQHKLQLK